MDKPGQDAARHEKEADPDEPIHELIARRWSPYAFSAAEIPRDDLRALFEAARWAPSSYNEQPWRYLVATRDDTPRFERLLSCLVEGNQAWARYAGALALGLTRRTFARNGRPNAAAEHDLGLAAAHLTFEATRRGLYVHQMIGIQPERIRALYAIPEDVAPLTALAIGSLAVESDLPERLLERDRGTRERLPLSEFVFGAGWDEPADLS